MDNHHKDGTIPRATDHPGTPPAPPIMMIIKEFDYVYKLCIFIYVSRIFI